MAIFSIRRVSPQGTPHSPDSRGDLGRSPVNRRALVLSFSTAIALHFSWDWMALAAADRTMMSTGLTLLAAAIMMVGVGILRGARGFGLPALSRDVRTRERTKPLGLSVQESVSVKLFVTALIVTVRSLLRSKSRFHTRTS